MGYVVGFLGAVLVFVGVSIVSTVFLWQFLPSAMEQWIGIGGIVTSNIVGVLLGSLAATASFRATLKHYRKKTEGGTRQDG